MHGSVNTTYAESAEPDEPGGNSYAARFVASVIVSTEASASILGNALVLFVSLSDIQVRHHRASLLVVSLALTDLLTAFLVMIPSIFALSDPLSRPLGYPPFCTFHAILNYWLTTTSSITLAMIALDRGLAIRRPLEYVQRSTMSRICRMVALPWTLGIVFALVPALLHWTDYQFDNIVCDVDWHPRHEHRLFYAALFTICFAIPAAIIVVQYARIMLSVQRLHATTPAPIGLPQRCKAKDSDSTSSQSSQNSDGHQKIFLSILAVIAIFFVCITPFCCTKLVKVLYGPKAIPDWLDMLSTVVQFLASVVNPFVYSIGLRSFREALCRLIRTGRHRLLLFYST
ncbi:D(1B) dopamine receptor-like [Ornithodoros turicata]